MSSNGRTSKITLSEFMIKTIELVYHYNLLISTICDRIAALDIKDSESYQNLMNSFTIPAEVSDHFNELMLISLMLRSN
jgi:hypothetical protein